MDLSGIKKICLVTGGSRGIGKGIALELAKNGHIVYVTGRDIQALEKVANEVPVNCGRIHPIECDHSVDGNVDALFETISDQTNARLDLLVNNASAAASFLTENSTVPFWDLSPDAWDSCNEVGLRNSYRCSVLASRMMVKQGSGMILNITSISTLSYTLTPAYGVWKCALDRMTRDCAIELKRYNVSVISLWPGCVKTEHLIETLLKDENNVSGQKERAEYLLKNGESPSFVGKAVLHLLTDSNAMRRTGCIISTAEVSREFGFTDSGRRPLDFTCLKDMMELSGFNITALLIPSFIRLPRWILALLLAGFIPDKNKSIYSP